MEGIIVFEFSKESNLLEQSAYYDLTAANNMILFQENHAVNMKWNQVNKNISKWLIFSREVKIMLQIAWIDWIGYAASLLILISFLTSSIVRLRLINLVGCGVFSTYGFLIHSIPTGVMNFMIAIINIYFLIKLFRKKEQYTILPTQKEEQHLEYFLSFYKRDIEKFYPDFDFTISDGQINFYILRDMVIAGLFVGNLIDTKTLLIRLEYAVPAYRDMKVGKYLYSKKHNFTENGEISTLVTYAKDETNKKYFKAMGFVEDANYPGGLVRKMAE